MLFMDPLTAQVSLGALFVSSSSALWFLHKQHALQIRRYASIEARLNEIEVTFSEIKTLERELRRRHAEQADLRFFEDKLSRAEKEMLAIKAK